VKSQLVTCTWQNKQLLFFCIYELWKKAFSTHGAHIQNWKTSTRVCWFPTLHILASWVAQNHVLLLKD
jgi:hypothetical protein